MKEIANKLVSVIIPTYKTDESLKRAIDSIINQIYKNWEIIVVDDNNSDTEYRKVSEKIMIQYKSYDNIKYIKHNRNKNGSAARNTGLKNANGDYICFLDDDDYFYDNKILLQVEELNKNENVSGVSCFYKRDGHINKFDTLNNFTKEILLCKKYPQTSSFMLRKEAIKKINGFDESYYRHQDLEFQLRFYEHYKIIVIPQALYELGRNTANNQPKGEKLEDLKRKFLKDFSYLIDKNNLNKRKIYAVNFSRVIFAYITERKIKKVIKIFKEYGNIYMIFSTLNIILKSIKLKFFRLFNKN